MPTNSPCNQNLEQDSSNISFSLKTAACLLPCCLTKHGTKFQSSSGKVQTCIILSSPSTGLQTSPGWDAKLLLCSSSKVRAASRIFQINLKYSADFTAESLAMPDIKDCDPFGCSCKRNLISSWWVDRRVESGADSCNLQWDFEKLERAVLYPTFGASETENGQV